MTFDFIQSAIRNPQFAIERSFAKAADGVMCAMMNGLQWRLRHDVCSSEQFEAYLSRCEKLTREEFYQVDPPIVIDKGETFEWHTPQPSGFIENDTVHGWALWCVEGRKAPTVLILHALMSASDIGYRMLGSWFNKLGWNAVFLHLPFHYSRIPKNYINGSLAITADLVRNGETLRQGVKEVRQLIAWLRAQGCEEFGMVATSYGGWIGGLTLSLEGGFRFAMLLQPIVNVAHAIWRNPASATIRRLLKANGIQEDACERHVHLSSPLHGKLLATDYTLLLGGAYDEVSPISELRALQQKWPNCDVIEVRQGHYGHRVLRVGREIIGTRLKNFA